MIILRLLLLLTNLHLKLLSTQGTGADKLLSTQRVKNRLKSYGEQNGYAKNLGEPFMAHLKIVYNIPWYWYLAAIYIELLYSIPCITEYNHTSTRQAPTDTKDRKAALSRSIQALTDREGDAPGSIERIIW